MIDPSCALIAGMRINARWQVPAAPLQEFPEVSGDKHG
jgi:hypothetical protein